MDAMNTVVLSLDKGLVVSTWNKMPMWAVEALGREVELVTEHDEYGDAQVVHQAGTRGKLAMVDYQDGIALAVVAFDPDDWSCYSNVPFDRLKPVAPLASWPRQ